MRKSLCLFPLLLLLCGSPLYGAVTLSAHGTFLDAVGPGGMIVAYCGGTAQPACDQGDPVQVRWGEAAEAEPSGLGFASESGVVVGPAPFLVGSMTHYNFPIFAGTNAELVVLSIQVLVQSGDTAVIFDELVAIELAIDETPNVVETCIYPSETPCADKVTLVGGAEGNVFTRRVGNVEYTLTLLGFRGSREGDGEVFDAFISEERQLTTAYLLASFSERVLVRADAGVDQVVGEGSHVTLDGTRSSGIGLGYAWTQLDGPAASLTPADRASASFVAPLVQRDSYATFQLEVTDGIYASRDSVQVLILNVNQPPSCAWAAPSEASLWPPNHSLREIRIQGVTDPDGDAVSIAPVAVYQDEPVLDRGSGQTAPDAILGGATVHLRAERTGRGNGRVYSVLFTASDGIESCSASVEVGAPHDRHRPAVADTFDFDSTGAN